MPESDAASSGPEPLQLPAGVHQLCSCGRSRHGWFCDGAHLGSGRVWFELRLSEPATVLMCRCGRSHPLPPLRWRPCGPGPQAMGLTASIVLAADDPQPGWGATHWRVPWGRTTT